MSNVIHFDFITRSRVDGPTGHTITSRPLDWSFESLQERLRDRYGDHLPPFVENAWKRPQTEPYRFGCVHNIAWRTVGLSKRYWNRPMPFPMPMDPSTDSIGREVYCGGTDPLAWLDLKYRVTHNHILSRRGKPLTIHTRSDLVAHDDYVTALDPVWHRVYIHVSGLTAEECRRLEPGAPSDQRRVAAVDRLIEAGIPVYIVHDHIQAIKEAKS